MLTQKLANRRAPLIAGLIAGLIGPAASAADIVTAYGDTAIKQAHEMDAEFKARMDQSARNLDLAVRANVEREVTRIKVPAIRVALGETVKRG